MFTTREAANALAITEGAMRKHRQRTGEGVMNASGDTLWSINELERLRRPKHRPKWNVILEIQTEGLQKQRKTFFYRDIFFAKTKEQAEKRALAWFWCIDANRQKLWKEFLPLKATISSTEVL